MDSPAGAGRLAAAAPLVQGSWVFSWDESSAAAARAEPASACSASVAPLLPLAALLPRPAPEPYAAPALAQPWQPVGQLASLPREGASPPDGRVSPRAARDARS